MADEADPLKRGVPLAASLVPGSRQAIVAGEASEHGLDQKAALIGRFLDTGEI
jgi:hypothetical protein